MSSRLVAWLRVWSFAGLFTLVALPFCVVVALIMPPGQWPDEPAHILRADSLTHRQWVGSHFASTTPLGGAFLSSGVLADPALLTVSFGLPWEARAQGQRMTFALFGQLASVAWTDSPQLIAAPNVAVYPPPFYLPAALALLVAKHTDWGPLAAILAARIVNAATFVSLGMVALLLAPDPMLLVMLLMPMTLGLAASINPDGLTIATTALACALLSRGLARGARLDWTFWLATLALGCVIAQKPPLAPIAGLLLLPLRAPAWRSPAVAWARVAGFCVAGGMGVAWFLLAQHEAGAPFVIGAPFTPGPLFEGVPGTLFATTDSAAQLHVLLAAPSRLITLPVRTFAAEWAFKRAEFIGVMGWLAVSLHEWTYRAWYILILGAVCCTAVRRREEPSPAWTDILLVGLIAAAIFELVYVSQYMSWTHVGLNRIDGVQGRYFLYLLAVVMFLVPKISLPHPGWLRAACLFGITVIAAITSVSVLGLLVRAYYLPKP